MSLSTPQRIIRCETTGEIAVSYGRYLYTEHWRHLRAVKRAGEICERCSYPILLEFDVHHKHYKTLGNESPDDLMLLHPICHGLEHSITPERFAHIGSDSPLSVLVSAVISRMGRAS